MLDGGFTNNVPVFTDHKHRQFVLKLSELDYSPKLLLNASGGELCRVVLPIP